MTISVFLPFSSIWMISQFFVRSPSLKFKEKKKGEEKQSHFIERVSVWNLVCVCRLLTPSAGVFTVTQLLGWPSPHRSVLSEQLSMCEYAMEVAATASNSILGGVVHSLHAIPKSPLFHQLSFFIFCFHSLQLHDTIGTPCLDLSKCWMQIMRQMWRERGRKAFAFLSSPTYTHLV